MTTPFKKCGKELPLADDSARGKNAVRQASQINETKEALLNYFHAHGQAVTYPPGVVLFQQDKDFANIYLLERGLVGLSRAENTGDEMILELRTAGNLLGAASALSQNPVPVATITLTECDLYSLSVKAFFELLDAEPRFLRLIAERFGQQYFEQTARLARIGIAKARANIAQYLLGLIPEAQRNQPGEIRLQLPFRQNVIAKLLAITDVHFSRTLRYLERDGVIRRHKGWIYVRDIKRLAAEAG